MILAGCAAPDPERAAEDTWAAMGYDGKPPVHDAAAVRATIASITMRSDRIILEGSTDADCEPYLDAFKVLILADFDDPRQDYMAPLKESLSQVHYTCSELGTWRGAIDDVLDVYYLGTDYLNKF